VRILVTGGAGFIGSHVAERLLARGDVVVGLDSFDETLYSAAEKRRNLPVARSSFQLVEADLLDPGALDRAFETPPDAVVHLAALAGVRPSLREPARYMRVNVEGTAGLLERCRNHGVRRFVFASSSSVYGIRSNPPFRESDPAVSPASPYAASKRAGELLCATYHSLYGIGATSLRFFTVYGPRQRPDLAIRKFTELIHRGAPIPIFGDGSTARDYTWIDDIVDGVLAALDRCVEGNLRLYNLGGSGTTTLAELIRHIEAALGKAAIPDRRPEQPGDVQMTCADVTLAGRELDFAPRVAIGEGIARFVRWYLAERA
jgi:UDP-glucuronate 4-epimerase